MRVQIDSSEDLSSVLRVVGALYGVELSVGGDAPTATSTPAPAATSSAGRSTGRRSGRSTATKSTGKRAAAPAAKKSTSSSRSMSDVRAWAKDNGHQVSARGPISAGVLSAYDAAN